MAVLSKGTAAKSVKYALPIMTFEKIGFMVPDRALVPVLNAFGSMKSLAVPMVKMDTLLMAPRLSSLMP